MQIVTNQKFISNRVTFARWGSVLGFLTLLGGFVISLLGPEWILPSYVALIFGFMLFNVSRYNSIRFGIRPREDEILANSLKGLDYKYRLVNYSDEVPVPHFLLSPYGVYVLETRHHWGDIRNQGKNWKHRRGFWEWMRTIAVGSIGNPSQDALRGVATIRKHLQERLGDEQAAQVSVEGVVVFTSARAQVTAVEPLVPVVSPKDLRSYVRSPQGKEKLPAALARSVSEAFEAPEPSKTK